MIRSILVALDDTPGAGAARDLAIALARRTGAALTAAVVLDRPHTLDAPEPVPAGGSAFKARRDAALAARMRAEAEAAMVACRAAADGLSFRELLLEDAPEPALRRAGALADLLVIGRDSTLGMEENEDGVAPVIEALLREGARPLLVVPPGAGGAAEGPVLVAYDGSIPAMRALQLFCLLGLAEGARVRVASVAGSAEEATALAEEGAAYLRVHGVAAEPLPVAGEHPEKVLGGELQAMGARLLVMGAYSGRGIRAWLLGSSTRRMLLAARCPVFVHH
jgi:nucleotide-binding universal stress UspA family protein